MIDTNTNPTQMVAMEGGVLRHFAQINQHVRQGEDGSVIDQRVEITITAPHIEHAVEGIKYLAAQTVRDMAPQDEHSNEKMMPVPNLFPSYHASPDEVLVTWKWTNNPAYVMNEGTRKHHWDIAAGVMQVIRGSEPWLRDYGRDQAIVEEQKHRRELWGEVYDMQERFNSLSSRGNQAERAIHRRADNLMGRLRYLERALGVEPDEWEGDVLEDPDF